MTMDNNNHHLLKLEDHSLPIRFLDADQVVMNEEALASRGGFGEIRLVVENGWLRFLVTQKSFDAQKWQSGTIATNGE
jgi:hypothetical protein